MELIKCPVCGRMVDNRLTKCILCKTDFEQYEKAKSIKQSSENDSDNGLEDPHVVTDSAIVYHDMVSGDNQAAGISADEKYKKRKNQKIIVVLSILFCVAVIWRILCITIVPVIAGVIAKKEIKNHDYDMAMAIVEAYRDHDKENDIYLHAKYEKDIAQTVFGYAVAEGLFGDGDIDSSNKIVIESVAFFVPKDEDHKLIYSSPFIVTTLDLTGVTWRDDERKVVFWFNEEEYVSSDISSLVDFPQNYDEVKIDVDIDQMNKIIEKSNKKARRLDITPSS